jgi:Protein of unknown function (DUF2937)
VEWLARKLDAFLGGVVIAAAGIAASQAHAFMIQYIQRLGGHLDEAKSHLNNVQHGLRYQLMSDTVRKELEDEASRRVAELQNAYHAIADADVVTKPFALIRHADKAMLAGTWHDFVPALPTTTDSIFYVVVAMVLGFVVYEIVKLPVVMLLQEPRRRKFRRRA